MFLAGCANQLSEARRTWKDDLLASLVVFLVALPLCIGIAVASGAPAVAGIVSGIIGGLLVATLGGCPMQVSGPANGLIVVVLLVTQQYGLGVLGAAVLLAGLIQLAAGALRLGQVFRAVPPAVIRGLMTGFAVIIFASQFHVMFGAASPGGVLADLAAIPTTVRRALAGSEGSVAASLLGLLTIMVLVGWKHVIPKRYALIPASLVAVAGSIAIAQALSLSVSRVQLPDNLSAAVRLIDLETLRRLTELPILQIAATIAFLASMETLLSATAVDKLHNGPRTNYDRELMAQGAGNVACGLLGAVPLSGVIIRSAANVSAGAKTRMSSMLHGFWMLVFVAFLPGLLTLIPMTSLAAILILAVTKLVDIKALKEMAARDRRELLVYFVTAGGVVGLGVLPGVALGVGLALLKLCVELAYLRIRAEEIPEHNQVVLRLSGSAIFPTLPKLAACLDRIPPTRELHIHLEDLNLVDQSFMDLLLEWEDRCERSGGMLVFDWNQLAGRLRSNDARSAAKDAQEPRDASRSEQCAQFLVPGWTRTGVRGPTSQSTTGRGHSEELEAASSR